MTSKLPLFAAALAAMTAASPVFAQDSMIEVSSKVVRYDDLNLTNARGRERLETRVRMAANAVCGTRDAFTLQQKQAAQTCRDAALAKTAPKVAAAILRAGPRLAGRTAE